MPKFIDMGEAFDTCYAVTERAEGKFLDHLTRHEVAEVLPSLLRVLDAQRQSNRADMLLVQGQVQHVVNLVSLYKALGGGWEVAEPAPATQSVATSQNKGNVP